MRSAQASVETARAALLPQFSGDGGIQTTKQSLNEGYPPSFQQFLPAGYHTQTRIAADLDWQLDFFGRNRAALAAATSTAQAVQADAAAARLQLTVAVASATETTNRVKAMAARRPSSLASMPPLRSRTSSSSEVSMGWTPAAS